jgi:hypothetical protein
MPRFRVTHTTHLTEIAFDDGGMNLLSSATRCANCGRPPRGVVAGRCSSAPPSRVSSPPAPTWPRCSASPPPRPTSSPASGRRSSPPSSACPADRRLHRRRLLRRRARSRLAFDVRLATPRSRFAHPGARIGIVTGFGGTSRWRKVLTRAAANQLFLANRVFSASEALDLGLVDRVAESHDDEIARMSALDPAATRLVKELAQGTELSRMELLRLTQSASC